MIRSERQNSDLAKLELDVVVFMHRPIETIANLKHRVVNNNILCRIKA